MPWTMESLERACRKVFRERTSVSLAALKTHVADVEPMPDGSQKVRLDNLTVPLLDGAVHEMLHVVLADHLRQFDCEIEEAIIEGIEKELVDRINRSRRRTTWWRQALKRKLR